jgi:hypothetical protein
MNNVLLIYTGDYDLIQAIAIDDRRITPNDARRIARGQYWHIPWGLGSWSVETALQNADRILQHRKSVDECIAAFA